MGFPEVATLLVRNKSPQHIPSTGGCQCEEDRAITTAILSTADGAFTFGGATVFAQADLGDVTVLMDGIAVFVGLAGFERNTLVTDGTFGLVVQRLARDVI